MKDTHSPPSAQPAGATAPKTGVKKKKAQRGFILVLVVGMLAVLAILGYSFAEQGRIELIGAGNSRDAGALDGLAESGFQIGLRILADDTNVWSKNNAGWDTSLGPGWTSRWNYSPYVEVPVTTVPARGVKTDVGLAPNDTGPAPNRANPQNFLDSWACLTWNDEMKGTNDAFSYGFTFDSANPGRSRYSQRHPQDPRVLLDNWQLQPLARVKKWRVRFGSSYGMVQVAIAPTDGAINVNDVFDPGTITERPGVHDTGLYGGTVANADPYAAPDRRTMEYVLGRRPEWASMQDEFDNDEQYSSNTPVGAVWFDTGVYNFRSYFEPGGRSSNQAPAYPPSVNYANFSASRMTNMNPNEPMYYHNAAWDQPYRYNFEGSRYVMYVSTNGMSQLFDYGDPGDIWNVHSAYGKYYSWYHTGRYKNQPYVPNPANGPVGARDALFQGFGFSLTNPKYAGLGAAYGDLFYTLPLSGQGRYHGAGTYGQPYSRSFQQHYLPMVAGGRFWTDLMADYYFGGAPGYTTHLGVSPVWFSSYNRWVSVGSGYDSLGIGTNRMPPTTHLWNAGARNNYQLTGDEINRGLTRYPGGMPPAKPAATYLYPMRKWSDDNGVGGAHFTFNNQRVSIRASGIQENWGKAGIDDPKGRFYDAININVTSYQVVYGLLTPEKIPSMMNRTTVAAHLHWKARYLDGAYKGMETFKRYNPNSPDVATPYDPWDDTLPAGPTQLTKDLTMKDFLFGRIKDPTQPYDPVANPVEVYDTNPLSVTTPNKGPNAYIGPGDFRYSIHRHYEPHPTVSPGAVPRRVFGKMDWKTPDPRTGVPADDVFVDSHYDPSLSPNSMNPGDPQPTSTMAPRPFEEVNWADWFDQRRIAMPKNRQAGLYKPSTNKSPDLKYSEGMDPGLITVAADDGRAKLFAKPHPLHGLPNPDYMQCYPGSIVSIFWMDNFRRYFPVASSYPLGAAQAPGAPLKKTKVVDENNSSGAVDPNDRVYPDRPTAKGPTDASNTQFVPAIGKDDAWRVTRIGRKYQEIVADAIMGYQCNPWWPNPSAPNTSTGEVAVPLDKLAYPCETRTAAFAAGITNPHWFGYEIFKGKAGIDMQIPDYYAYFNRFWIRPCMKYTRNGAVLTVDRGEPYRPSAGALAANPVEGRGIYPQPFQYFGQELPGKDDYKDRIIDFPQNTLEDQLGSNWRYETATVASMQESNMRIAPARNHPFKNWADFVAMLGHLVYRPPTDATNRHPALGVDAWKVCHGPKADPRNTKQFFDGSMMSTGAGADAIPDALQGKTGGRPWSQAIVARDGYWPISANMGAFPDPITTGGAEAYLFPNPPAGSPWAADIPEWKRRIDEWRGRDAAGLRIEQNYISERAANDILVSLSNGRIGPIDFDGDGHIEMTRASEIPDQAKYWPGFPWNNDAGVHPSAEYEDLKSTNPNFTNTGSIDYGIAIKNGGWKKSKNNEVITECVTLPIKFRSNTFRITVVVELTDPDYKVVYSTRRYTRVYSRVPGEPANGIKVFGPYTGEFILHSNRDVTGPDPDLSFLGVE